MCDASPRPVTPVSRNCFASSPPGLRSGTWSRSSAHEAALAPPRAAAEVAHRAAAAARGTGEGRQRQARHPDHRRRGVLGRRLRGAVLDIAKSAESRGAGTAHSRQDPRADSAFLYLLPGPLERHHGAVELFPREGPRPARLGAGRLAAAVSRQTRRDTTPFVVDGGADGRADPGGLRRRVQEWRAVRAVRRPRDRPDADSTGGAGLRGHAGAGEHLPGAADARSAVDHRAGRRGRRDPALPGHWPELPGPAVRIPQLLQVGDLPRGAELAFLAGGGGAHGGVGYPPARPGARALADLLSTGR